MKFEPSVSGIFIVLIFPWISGSLKSMGYVPYRGMGLAIGLAQALLTALLVLGVDYGLARLGLAKPVRSGVWWSAMFGPLTGFAVFNEWGSQMWGQVTAVVSTLAAFALGYAVDVYADRRNGRHRV